MSSYLDLWKENWLPEMNKGDFQVSRFEILEQSISMRMLVRPDEYIPPGVYTRLICQGQTWMSNTPFEYRSNRKFLSFAEGNVLIGGLGLGLLPRILCPKDSVKSVTVFEISQDLIDLMLPHLDNPKLTIKQIDVLQHRPEKQEVYDSIWFDIWPSVCLDNLTDITTLNRRWSGKHWTKAGPRESWFEARLKRDRKAQARLNRCGI